MRWRYILNVVGILNLFFGLMMTFPLLWDLYFDDQSVMPLLKSMGITVGAGLMLYAIFGRTRVESIRQREGMAIVAVAWTTIGFFSAPILGAIIIKLFPSRPSPAALLIGGIWLLLLVLAALAADAPQ